MSKSLENILNALGGAKSLLSEGSGEAKQHLRASLLNMLEKDFATKAELDSLKQTIARQQQQLDKLKPKK